MPLYATWKLLALVLYLGSLLAVCVGACSVSWGIISVEALRKILIGAGALFICGMCSYAISGNRS